MRSSSVSKGALRFWQLALLVAVFVFWHVATSPTLLPPLYFEDPQLERYGHSFPPCCQPLISGAHFFTRLPILPYW